MRETWQAILVILSLAFLVGGFLYYRTEGERNREEQYHAISGIAGLKARQLELWRFERLGDARAAAGDPALAELSARYLQNTGSPGLRERLVASLESRVNAYRYSKALLLSPAGVVVASFPEEAGDLHWKDIPSFPSTEPRLSMLYPSAGGAIRLDAVAPLKDSAGRVLGYMVLRSDPGVHLKSLLRFWPMSDRGAQAWIVERQGKNVAWLVGQAAGIDTLLTWGWGPLEEAPDLVRAALDTRGRYPAGAEKGILADLRPVDGSSWRLITQVDEDLALAEGRFRIRAILVLFAGILLLAAASFVLFQRHRQAAQYRERYLAERRLTLDREERRILLDSIGDAVVTAGNDGRVREMNPAAAGLTGWTEEEARGRSLDEVVRTVDRPNPNPPPPLPGAAQQDPSALREVNTVLIRRDGSERIVRRNASPILDSEGAATGSVVVLSDQGRQHAAREALREGEARLRGILESLTLIAVVIDGKGRLSVCSDHLLTLSGWRREDVIGRDYFERFIPADARPKVRAAVDGILAAGVAPGMYENEIVTRHGRRLLISWSNSVLLDSEGRSAGVVGIGEDVTDRRMAEERIRRSEQRLHLLVEHCPGAIAMFDREMRYLVVSPRWLEDYHLGAQSVLGRSHYEVFPDIPDRWKEIHRRCLDGASEKCEEDPFPRADGGTEWIRWEIHPWRDDQGETGGIVMFTEVITERIQAQEALRKLNAELETRVQERTAQLSAMNKELETFSYSVSHDLKAPLRGIDGYSKILIDEYQNRIDEEGRGFLRNIRAGAEQMRQLIEDMLDYSRLERRSISLVPVDLRHAVDRVLQERKFELGDAKVSIELARGSVTADPEGLAMVVRNLVDNALKFSRLRNPPEVEIRSRIGEGRHVLSIRDNGTGFAMKHHDLIFQIFQRLHRSEDYGGTGVGLAIVKKAVDRMDGRVWAESEPDRGAVFNVELPCAPEGA